MTAEEFLRDIVDGKDLPGGLVNQMVDVHKDPQVAHNETAPEVEDSRFGALTRYLRHPVRYGRTPATLRRHAPRMGEHTDEILGEIGLEAEEIDGLRRSGAAR